MGFNSRRRIALLSITSLSIVLVSHLVRAETPSVQTWINPECATGPCELKSANLTTYPDDSATAMVASFTTSTLQQLGDFVYVQFIRGCSFEEDSKGNKKLIMQDQYWGKQNVPFDHTDWQMDEGTQDPVYWGVPAHYDPLRQRNIPRDARYSTSNPITDSNPDIWYGSILGLKVPTLYVADEPTQVSQLGQMIGLPNLEFQTCLYRVQDVPTTLSAPDQPIPNALHCFSWQSNYTFNWQTMKFSPASQIDPFCGVKE